MKYKVICLVIAVLLFVSMFGYRAEADELSDTYRAEAYVLMEASTGTVIVSKNADLSLRPASLLIFISFYLRTLWRFQQIRGAMRSGLPQNGGVR